MGIERSQSSIQRIRQQSGGIRQDASYDFETANKRGDEFRFRRPYFLISANAEFVILGCDS
jgi:hypothetical protein